LIRIDASIRDLRMSLSTMVAASLRHSALHYLVGGVAVALLTWLCFWLQFSAATAAFAYLVLIVLSLADDRSPTVIIILAATACLIYFFTQPPFSFWIARRSDAVLVLAFLTASLAAAGVIARSRIQTQEAVSARQALEQALKENDVLKNEFRITFDTIPTLSWVARPDGSVEFLNQRWLEYTGLSLKQAREWGWVKVIHPEDVNSALKAWRAIAALGEPGELEARLRRSDGEYRWFLLCASPLRNEQEKIARWYGTCIDIEDRKRAERRSQQAEQELRAAIDTIPTQVWTCLPDGTNDFSNKRLLTYTNFSLEDARDMGWTPMIHPDDLAAHLDKWRVATRTGTSFESEARLRRFDGTYRWFLFRAEPWRDERGNIVKWYGSHTDIEDRKQAEQARRRTEAYLSHAQRLSRVGSFGWTPSTGEIHWSEESFRIFEFDSCVRPTIEFILQRVHPEDVSLVRQAIDVVSEGERDLDFTHRLLMPDGSVKHVHVLSHAVRDASGVMEVVGALMDVTAVKAAQDALRENEQRFRDYAETASDWLWESGPDHRFTHISSRLKAAGYDPVGAIGRTRWESAACIEEEAEEWQSHRATLDAHQPFRSFTYRLARGDGSFLYVSTSGRPRFDVDGNFLGYRGAATDITAEVRASQAEEALNEARAELSHVTRVTTLGELAASIAHEVNQPLAAIVTNADASLRWLDRGRTEEARRSLERIISDADRASAVIHRTRQLSKKADPEKAHIEINDVINDAMLLIQSEAASHDVSLQLELASGLPTVFGDRVQLQQVIINLVMNGIEAMAGLTNARELLIRSGQCEADQVVVAVTDVGAGIDPQITNKLFNAFFTTKPNGMGMGLSICRSIIEAHEGRLWASRNSGPGTTFHFKLRADPTS
jgi:PAS domain S-box-containing protein